MVKSQVKSFGDLLSAESYIIKVVAIIPPKQFNTSFGKVSVSHQSFPATIKVYTSPKPPSSLRVGKVDLHSISITWVAPKIAKGSTITEFLVKYVVLNNKGNSGITGTEKIRSAQKNSNFLITDLAMGTLYGISVAVTKFHISYSNLILHKLNLALSRKTLAISIHAFFISNTCMRNGRLKLPKNQANAKEDPEAELLLFENYSHSSST